MNKTTSTHQIIAVDMHSTAAPTTYRWVHPDRVFEFINRANRDVFTKSARLLSTREADQVVASGARIR